jgi:hypothetical protein
MYSLSLVIGETIIKCDRKVNVDRAEGINVPLGVRHIDIESWDFRHLVLLSDCERTRRIHFLKTRIEHLIVATYLLDLIHAPNNCHLVGFLKS